MEERESEGEWKWWEKVGGREWKRKEEEEEEKEKKTSLISFIIIHISKVNSSDHCHWKDSLLHTACGGKMLDHWLLLREALGPSGDEGPVGGNCGNNFYCGFFGGRNRCIRESQFRIG